MIHVKYGNNTACILLWAAIHSKRKQISLYNLTPWWHHTKALTEILYCSLEPFSKNLFVTSLLWKMINSKKLTQTCFVLAYIIGKQLYLYSKQWKHFKRTEKRLMGGSQSIQSGPVLQLACLALFINVTWTPSHRILTIDVPLSFMVLLSPLPCFT